MGMEKLSQYIADAKISQAEFSRIIGVHPSVLCKYLRKKAKPSYERAYAIERATGGAVPASSWLEDAA